MNTRLVDREVEHIVRDSDAAAVLHGALPDGVPHVVDARDPAAIFYTSGTTGYPKGAVLTHENFLTNAENGLRVSGLPRADPDLRNLVSVPLFHVAACNSQLIPTVQVAGTTVVMPAFDVDRFLRAIVEERIRVVSSAPAIFWRALHHPEFHRYDVSGVGWATYGGAPVAPALVRRIKHGFPEALVGNGFGLTETSSLSTYRFRSPVRRSGFCGLKPLSVTISRPLSRAAETPFRMLADCPELLIAIRQSPGRPCAEGWRRRPSSAARRRRRRAHNSDDRGDSESRCRRGRNRPYRL